MVVKYMTLIKEDGKIYMQTWIQIERHGKIAIKFWRRTYRIGDTHGKQKPKPKI